jgi:hypothetical protein
MLPKLNRRRAMFVLTKIDEILAWKSRRTLRGIPGSLNSGVTCAKCGRDSTDG